MRKKQQGQLIALTPAEKEHDCLAAPNDYPTASHTFAVRTAMSVDDTAFAAGEARGRAAVNFSPNHRRIANHAESHSA